MFQPKPVPILPKLVKARVPVWVLAAALVAQAAIVAIGKPDDPSCALKFQQIHYSTSVKRNKNIDSVKLNITSKCTGPQKSTRLKARIFAKKNGTIVPIYESAVTVQRADPNNLNEAEFLDFWVECKKNSKVEYQGDASGEVLLSNGTTAPVSGSTVEFSPVLCNFKAK